MFGIGEIFILFFVTLGPMKLLGPFEQQTRELSPSALRGIAVRAFVIGLSAVMVGGTLGTALAIKWRISVPAIEIATGITLFLVAIRLILAGYEAAPAPQPLPEASMAATLRLTFPLVVSPYGIAALIALLASTDDPAMIRAAYVILVIVTVLNLLAMLYVRSIMRGVMLLVLQVLGSVLAAGRPRGADHHPPTAGVAGRTGGAGLGPKAHGLCGAACTESVVIEEATQP
jgi:small neutral amino acid transporter SnatA (MarC family)